MARIRLRNGVEMSSLRQLGCFSHCFLCFARCLSGLHLFHGLFCLHSKGTFQLVSAECEEFPSWTPHGYSQDVPGASLEIQACRPCSSQIGIRKARERKRERERHTHTHTYTHTHIHTHTHTYILSKRLQLWGYRSPCLLPSERLRKTGM